MTMLARAAASRASAGVPTLGKPSAASHLTWRPRSRRASARCSPVVAASALPQQLVGAAARAGTLASSAVASSGQLLAAAVDPSVLAATLHASAKLLIICAAVGWLLRTGRIPNSTATVLSKVSYEILIPAMLFSKVASTLAAQPDAMLLCGISAAALLQIALGAACGLVLTWLFGLGKPARQQPGPAGSSAGSWQGRTSPAAASAIALSLAAASGAPAAAPALRLKQPAPVAGPAQMVPAAAAFGNSFTLPAVFLTTLLPGAVADRALGYAALFLLAWSPCLWSIGLALVDRRQQPPAQPTGGAQPTGDPAGQQAEGAAAAGRSLSWRQQRVLDVTPLGPPNGGGGVGSGGSWSDADGGGGGGGAAEPPSWAQRLAVHPLTVRLCRFGGQVLNPPVVAILLGTLVGMTPAGRALMAVAQSPGAAAGPAAAAAAALPPELGLLQALARATLEVVELLAQGTLASQTLVLAASLLQQPEGPAPAAAALGPAASATAAAVARSRLGWVGGLKQLLPSDGDEARALAILSLTRFLLLPLASIGCLQALLAGGLLPPVLSDPVLLFVLLTEACMPSAQNLIILLQLSEHTQALAPGFARLLLKLYSYAVLPVTLWVTFLATNLGIPVAR